VVETFVKVNGVLTHHRGFPVGLLSVSLWHPVLGSGDEEAKRRREKIAQIFSADFIA
jgi:hypothetical protein